MARLRGMDCGSARAVQPIAEVAEARHDELVRVQSLVHDRGEDVHVGETTIESGDALRAPPRCRRRGRAGRRPVRAARARQSRCRRSPASGRPSARSSSRAAPETSRSTVRRPRSSRRAAVRCGRRAPAARARESRRACRARREHGHDRPRRRDAPAGGRTERRLDGGRRSIGTSRIASTASSDVMRAAARRNAADGVVLSRSSSSASWTSGWSTRWTGTAPHYTISASMRAYLAIRARRRVVARRLPVRTPGRLELVVVGEHVVTGNAAGQVLSPGAVAIDGDTIVDVGDQRRHSVQVRRRPGDRRSRSDRPARPDQHAHARADGALSRVGRRSGADGLAARSTSFRRKPRRCRRSSCASARGWPHSR